MGVLNITPDSFSDGGLLWRDGRLQRDAVLRRATAMCRDGAALLDVGGESTRPGATAPSEQEELDRVLPVLELLATETEAILSVDTSTPAVMREAARVGAGLINDVRALRRPGALTAAVDSGLPVCLMHMQGEPGDMQNDPRYTDVVVEVRDFLRQRVAVCEAAGLSRERLLIDPGFGFGKTAQHNLQLLRGLSQLAYEGLPLLVGLSRKSLIAAVTGRPVAQRLAGSLALAMLAVQHGARILRVHDVAETADVLALLAAVNADDEEN